jgi:hypothetical protein
MRHLSLLLMTLLLAACDSATTSYDDHDRGQASEEIERGPHGGRLLKQDAFALELAVFESGVPPEFRVWLFENGKPIPPSGATVEVALTRLGGKVDRFNFRPEADYLRGNGVVVEPHSFDVTVEAKRGSETLRWEFASHEGRTTIHPQSARDMGIDIGVASDAVIKEQLPLSGVIQADPSRISRVRARYPGVIREVAVQPWSTVARGAVLAQVQSNESLQNYAIAAPIGGVIVELWTCHACGWSSTCSRLIWTRSRKVRASKCLTSKAVSWWTVGSRESRRLPFTAARASARGCLSTTPKAHCGLVSSSRDACSSPKRACRLPWRKRRCRNSGSSTWCSSRWATRMRFACSSWVARTQSAWKC